MNSEGPLPLSVRRKLSRPALDAFFRIGAQWGLKNEEARVLLGRPSRSTYWRWKKDHKGAIGTSSLKRISYILGIYKALQMHFTSKEQADGWIHRPNSAALFAGRSALERMMEGRINDLRVVREYLENELV